MHMSTTYHTAGTIHTYTKYSIERQESTLNVMLKLSDHRFKAGAEVSLDIRPAKCIYLPDPNILRG